MENSNNYNDVPYGSYTEGQPSSRETKIKKQQIKGQRNLRNATRISLSGMTNVFSSETIGTFVLLSLQCHSYQEYKSTTSIISNALLTFGVLYFMSILSDVYVPSLNLLSCVLQAVSSMLFKPKESNGAYVRYNTGSIFLVSLAGILTGGALSALYLLAVLGTNNAKGAITIDDTLITPWHSMVLQVFVMTLYSVVSTNLSMRGNKREVEGRAILGAVLVAYSIYYTGGVIDPLRWFVPAVITSKWDNWWVWTSSACIAFLIGLIAHLTYGYILKRSEMKIQKKTTTKETRSSDSL